MSENELVLTSEQKMLAEQYIIRKREMEQKNLLSGVGDNLRAFVQSLGLEENTDFIITTRYKTDASITEKVARKGYTRPDQMNDLAGIEIVVEHDAMLDKIIPALTARYKIVEPPEDNRLSDRPYNGINTVIDFDGVHIEIQAKDIREKALGILDHETLMKNPAIPDNFRKRIVSDFRRGAERLLNKEGIVFTLRMNMRDMFIIKVKQLAEMITLACGQKHMKHKTKPYRKALVGANPQEKQANCQKIRIVKEEILERLHNIKTGWDRQLRSIPNKSRGMV
jgi:ppGpp synthetase/RelA/SpoT-type nucleotidyltranferase